MGIYDRGKGRGVKFLRDNVSHKGEACLIWPFSGAVRGYGNFGYLGKIYYAHRFMCELAHGAPPTQQHQAAHSCGQRNCVNPDHLSWKDNGENQKDRRKHGTHHGAKGSRITLTLDQLVEIRSSKGIITQDALAEKFGVKRGCIQYWQKDDHAPAPPGIPR